MSDEKPKAASIEAPLISWVKGGTSTSIHEQQLKQKRADAEKRRQEEAARQKTVTQDPVGARTATTKLGGHKSHAAIVLEIRNSDGKAEEFVMCELNVGRTDPTELVLVMCCPYCSRKNGMDESQFHFSNKHKRFFLDTRMQGQPWVNPNDTREIVMLAGTIELEEVVSCPTCTWRFKIANSVIKPL